MKVELYPHAEADIIRQFRYYLVDQDAPALAVRFREAVKESIEQLKSHPHMGTLVSRFNFRLSFMADKRF